MFQGLFLAEDHALKNYRGQWEEQLFARLTLELKGRCVCTEVIDERFRELREAVMAFQVLPEIKQQVQPNQANPKP